MTQHDDRVRSLLDEAKRLRYSRRQFMRTGATLGLSVAGIHSVLDARGLSAAPRVTRYLQGGGKLTILAGSYFVPEAQEFFVQQVTDWGSQNNTEVTCDFVNWPDIQAKVSAAVESGAGPDIVELREAWQYLYYEQMVDLNDIAMAAGDAAGGLLRLGQEHRQCRWRVLLDPGRHLRLGLRLPDQLFRASRHRRCRQQFPQDLGGVLRRGQEPQGHGQAARPGPRP